ncbi:MAG: hypothetical protein GY757_27100, partial [bacterium]|nr:hypothetical protein [bacterium]
MRKVVSASLISIVLLMLAACGGGVQKVNVDIHIPELDTAKYSDSAYIEGWKSLKAGNPAQAIKLFQQSNSVDEKLFVGFGYAFLAQSKISLAKRNFEKAVAVDADNLPAQLGLATMHEQMNEVESAYDIYSRLRSLYPEHAWV